MVLSVVAVPGAATPTTAESTTTTSDPGGSAPVPTPQTGVTGPPNATDGSDNRRANRPRRGSGGNDGGGNDGGSIGDGGSDTGDDGDGPSATIGSGKPPSNLTSAAADRIEAARRNATDGEPANVTLRINAVRRQGDRAERLARHNGATVRARAGEWIVVRIPADGVLAIKDHPSIRYVQTPVVPEPTAGSITSEGIYNISADEVHAEGYTGGNGTVAVIDLAFNASNPEIESNVVETRDMTDGSEIKNTSGEHGTAVSEVVVDTAPDVSLILLKIETVTEWRNAIDYAEKADVQVASLGVSVGPFDGRDALGNETEEAINNGTSSFVSAGNAGDGKHLNLTWSDPDGDDTLNFDGSDERLKITTTASSIEVDVSWNDYFRSDQDYDVYLFSDSGSVIDSSLNSQTGIQEPEESVSANAFYCPCELNITNDDASGTADFDLFANDGTDFEYSTSERSITRPATDEAPVTVGAVNFKDLTLEGYSSRGPTIDGRRKPEVVAPARVSTSIYGSEGFAGTSAAAPHAAGAAALLVDANTSLTPEYTERLLTDTARQTDPNYDTPDPNNQTGHGLVNASAALDQMQQASSNSPPTANDDSYTTEEDTTLSVSVPGVLGNDSDPDGDSLSASVVSGPSHGSLSLNADGSFTYDPDAGYNGSDSFSYEAADGNGGTDQAVVSIEVLQADLLTEEWTHSENSRFQYSSPALNATHAFVGGLGTDLIAVDRSSGSVEWRFTRTGSLADSSPTLDGGRAIVGGGGGTIYAIDTATGTADWTHSTDSAVVSSPAVSGGTVFVGSNDGTVLALDAADGSVNWTTGVGDSVFSTPEVSGGTVFVTTDDGRVIALAAADGSQEWSYDTGADLGHSSPLAAEGKLFVAADDVYAFDPSTGSVQWQYGSYGGTAGSTPAYDSGRIFVGSADGSVYAITTSGSLNWSYSTGAAVRSSPTVAGDRLLVGSDDGTTYLFDVDGDPPLATASTGPVGSTPAVDSNVAFVATWNGDLVALSNVTSTSAPVTAGPSDSTSRSNGGGSGSSTAHTDERWERRSGDERYDLSCGFQPQTEIVDCRP